MAPPRVLSQVQQLPTGEVRAQAQGMPDIEVGNPTVTTGPAAREVLLARALRAKPDVDSQRQADAAEFAAGRTDLLSNGVPVVPDGEAEAMRKLGMHHQLEQLTGSRLVAALRRRK